MHIRRRVLLLSSVFLVALTFGLVAFSYQGEQAAASTPTAKSRVYEFEASYMGLSRDQMIKEAGAIFVGEVVSLSPARWNQDSGEYWQEGALTTLPYHEVQVKVVQPLVDTVGLGAEAKITVLGGSPAGSIQTGELSIANQPEHTLQVGDQSVFFVVKREMAWRGGTAEKQATQPILRLVAMPKQSYLTRKNDGLYHVTEGTDAPLSLDTLRDLIKKQR